MSECRLPSLNALRCFEAVARLGSMCKAADELCVTNAAVSHQIRLLESELGLELFARRANLLLLTTVGEHYAPRVREAFRTLQLATNNLRRDKVSRLEIAVLPAFATKWLVPRLHRFYQQHPGIHIDITAQERPDPAQCALCIDDRQHPDGDYVVEPLLSTEYFPVCQSALAGELNHVRDLARSSLLHNRSVARAAQRPTWQRWVEAVGCPDVDVHEGMQFNDDLVTLQAAMEGQGVALAQRILVEYDLAACRLVRPFPALSALSLDYYLVYPHQGLRNVALTSFHRWLQAESHISLLPKLKAA
jgi:LysR family glycine cleavage system transcriptional activator